MENQTITISPISFAITMAGFAIGIGGFGAIIQFSSQSRTDILGLQFLIIVTISIITMCMMRIMTYNFEFNNLAINLITLIVVTMNIAFVIRQFISGEPFQYPWVTLITIFIAIVITLFSGFIYINKTNVKYPRVKFSRSKLKDSPSFFTTMVCMGMFVQLFEILLIALALT